MENRTLDQWADYYFALASEEPDPETKAGRIRSAEYYAKLHAENLAVGRRYMPGIASDKTMARIEPWGAELNPDELTYDTNDVDDILAKRILNDLEKRGISRVRITAQSPEGYVDKALAKLIGPLTLSQNDFDKDVIQLIEPKSSGIANSGNTLADLGLHVDGTQHDATPAVLMFHYVSGAKVGANSVFVDSVKALLDVDEIRRHEIMINLARPDAATFSKKEYGPHGSNLLFLTFRELGVQN